MLSCPVTLKPSWKEQGNKIKRTGNKSTYEKVRSAHVYGSAEQCKQMDDVAMALPTNSSIRLINCNKLLLISGFNLK